MRWGSELSVGHYLDLVSAVLGLTLFPIGYLLHELTKPARLMCCPRTGARIEMKRTLVSWSSGKDSAWSLHLLRQQSEYEIVGLLTTFNQAANRVAMHAVRRSLVEAQAKATGIPLWDVDLPWPCS